MVGCIWQVQSLALLGHATGTVTVLARWTLSQQPKHLANGVAPILCTVSVLHYKKNVTEYKPVLFAFHVLSLYSFFFFGTVVALFQLLATAKIELQRISHVIWE